ncbi:hypothetical protein NNC19_20500 [Clostridium sp. SHJSY1]|uniref:hypothetical protein n=1 Tax=Clostridium sp. SHJSY1 TaxID=2942483 RepID=UPI002876EE9E|nr:hypothetical protein [Clostridium sp. SHJSY1]MDS0528079.1 hypothetical protein [Clostridium sp. SHJSY1]
MIWDRILINLFFKDAILTMAPLKRVVDRCSTSATPLLSRAKGNFGPTSRNRK